MNDTTHAIIVEGEGFVGYLTWAEWERFTRAWQTALNNIGWWRVAGHLRSGNPDEHRSRSTEHQLVLPATWLAAEEISRLMGVLNDWPELEDAARDAEGCEWAMLLTREVETAHAKWPMADRPHKVRFLRCRACQELALKYFPPNLSGPSEAPRTTVRANLGGKQFVEIEVLDVNVKCTSCGARESSQMFEHDAELIRLEAENEAMAKRARSGRANGTRKEHGVQMGAGGAGADETPEEGAVVVAG